MEKQLQFCSSIVHTVLFNTIPDCWNGIYVFHERGLCVVLFLCLCFVSVCSEVCCRGWAWSSCLSHTYSSSNHQRWLKYSGPLSTRRQIVSTRRRGFYGWTTRAAYGDFLLLWYFVESRDSFLKSPHHLQSPCCIRAPAPTPFCCPASCTSATRQISPWIHLRLAHLCLRRSLDLPVLCASATPSAVPPAWAWALYLQPWAT